MKTFNIEDAVEQYGEKYRALIVDAIKFLDEREPNWNLDSPIDRFEYIETCISKVKK